MQCVAGAGLKEGARYMQGDPAIETQPCLSRQVPEGTHTAANQRHVGIPSFDGGDLAPGGLASTVPRRSGAEVGGGWNHQFADAPDVLKTAPDQKTVVR